MEDPGVFRLRLIAKRTRLQPHYLEAGVDEQPRHLLGCVFPVVPGLRLFLGRPGPDVGGEESGMVTLQDRRDGPQ